MKARKRSALLLAAFALVAVASATAAFAGANTSGFKTSEASMLTPIASGATVMPLITVGETLPGGYRFEAIPDGVAIYPRGQGRLDVFVNHETSRVPFPYSAVNAGTPEANQNDFDNSQLSRLVVNQQSGGILSGKMVIESNENFQRFCSNYLATEKEGFDRDVLFTNEEATDFVYRTGEAWPAAASDPGAEQAGLVVAYDVKNGKRKPIYGMGRHNHENSVAIPGFEDLVVLSGDDTFSTSSPGSQLYAYIAPDTDAIWNDTGQLYGLKLDSISSYWDVPIGSPSEYTGEFVPIDKTAAQGNQSALEAASDAAGVFQFFRIEDVAYDKQPGMSNVVYLADSGRGSNVSGPTGFASFNGRIWKLEFTDPMDPTQVKLSLLVEGENTQAFKAEGEIHQPDNLETTAAGSLLVQEDPASGQQFAANSTDPNATTARIWRVPLGADEPDEDKAVVAKVDQSADEGPTDVDGAGDNAPPANVPGALGNWESSGVVDVSSVWGPGTFLVTVQAHTLWIEKRVITPADDPDPRKWGFTNKREGGQLVLLKIPGA